MKFKLNWFRQKIAAAWWGVTITSASLVGVAALNASSASAAERLILRLGPFEQSMAVSDLEQFAKTGELPAALKPYAPIFTPQVQEILSRRLKLDPSLAGKLVDNILRSPDAEQIVKQIGLAIPNSTVEQLQAGLAIAMRQANGLSVLSFLRAYPAETITVDATAAASIALQLNTSYWQSQALGPLLEKELAVGTPGTFHFSFDPSIPGSQEVQQQTLMLQDQTRKRTIPVDIYWAKDTSGPLIVISPGFAADRTFLAYLAQHLASYGFTVAALEHPGSNVNALSKISLGGKPSDLMAPSEFLARPQDVSFLLDELANLNQQPGVLQGKFNTQEVSVIGHSLGGYTALALAGAKLNITELREFCQTQDSLLKVGADWIQCAAAELPEGEVQLQDQRVKQAIALNPTIGQLFGKKGLSQVNVPTLILTSTDDAITPAINHQLQPFTQLPKPKYLIAAINATHLSVSNSAHQNQNNSNPPKTLVNEKLGEETKKLQQLLQGTTLAFIKQLTPEAKTYQEFLTPEYAQSLSTTEIPLRLTKELPESVTSWFKTAAKP